MPSGDRHLSVPTADNTERASSPGCPRSMASVTDGRVLDRGVPSDTEPRGAALGVPALGYGDCVIEALMPDSGDRNATECRVGSSSIRALPGTHPGVNVPIFENLRAARKAVLRRSAPSCTAVLRPGSPGWLHHDDSEASRPRSSRARWSQDAIDAARAGATCRDAQGRAADCDRRMHCPGR